MIRRPRPRECGGALAVGRLDTLIGPPFVGYLGTLTAARTQGARPTFVRLARLYWRLAPPRGIRPELAYAQAAKETSFGRFTGVVDASFCNPCGRARTVQALGGARAPSRSYGREIVRMAREIGLRKQKHKPMRRPVRRVFPKPAPHFAESANL